jgi:hypothetical protein
MLNCKGVFTSTGNGFGEPFGPIDSESVIAPEVVVESFSELELVRSLKAPIDVLWNAVGRSASPFFDAAGTWIGPPLDRRL